MRNTTLWAASVALLCAPLLTSANAAPPHEAGIQRRYRVPVRRQNSGGIISNDTPISSVRPAPAASESMEAAPSTPASVPAEIIPSSVALPISVALPASADPPSSIALPSLAASVPSEPSISPVLVIVSSAAPLVEIIPSSVLPVVLLPSSVVAIDIPSSEAPQPAPASSAPPPPVQPSSQAPSVALPSSEAAPSNLFSSAAGQNAALPSVAILSEVVPVLASVIGVVPSLTLPSLVIPTLAPISEVLSSIVGGAVGAVSSIALPSGVLVEAVPSPTGYVAPSVFPSSVSPQASGGLIGSIIDPIVSLLLPSPISSAVPASSDGVIVPLVQSLLNPSGGLVSQIIVGLNTIISEALPLPSSVPAVASLGGLDLSSGIVPAPSALPTGNLDPIGGIQSILSGVISALPTGMVVIPSALPSIDISGGLASALPSVALPSDGIVSILPSGGLIPLPDPTGFPSSGGIIPSAGLALSPGVSDLFPQPSGLISENLPLPSAGVSALPPTPSGQVSIVEPPLSGGSPASPVSAAPLPSQSADNKPGLAGIVTAVQPTSTNTNDRLVSATGTDANTAIAGPSDIVIAPSDSSKPTSTPTNLPKVIQPPGGKVSKQANTTLVQLGFLEPLNYAFVSANEDAINQIFQFMPLAVANGLDSTDVRMQSIQPYDTLKTWKYMTTLAMLYVPTESVAQLTLALHNPGSTLYKNSDARITTLMSFVNPAIPLLAGQSVDPAAASAANPSYSPGSSKGADPFGEDSKTGNPVNTSSAAIATPLAVGAVVYGCAMIFVARRYKQRRQSHRRASSISGEPAWMTEARAYNNASRESHGSGSSGGGSARTQQISAPLTSSNSLGW